MTFENPDDAKDALEGMNGKVWFKTSIQNQRLLFILSGSHIYDEVSEVVCVCAQSVDGRTIRVDEAGKGGGGRSGGGSYRGGGGGGRGGGGGGGYFRGGRGRGGSRGARLFISCALVIFICG